MNRALARKVRERAGGRREYCGVAQAVFPLPFQIDHIISEKHGGQTVERNLAFAFTHCNLYKGPNIAGRDSISGELTSLFNPRTDLWDDHFTFVGRHIVGRTAVGRVTVQLLDMNTEDRLTLREELLGEGQL